MFGLFSLPKLLFTAFVIAAVWYGYKWYNRYQQVRQEDERDRVRRDDEKSRTAAVEDMVQCPDCGAYVPAAGGHVCGGGT